MALARTIARLLFLATVALALFGFAAGSPRDALAASGDVRVLRLDGIVNAVSGRYLARGIQASVDAGDVAVLIELDTPGGLLEATQELTSVMLRAEVPVIVFVAPAGARAASAGTFITMAGHIAVMAPSTRIGAATPVSGDGADIPDDLRAKIVNDSVVYARGIADARQRNADWAEQAVRDAVVVDADEAERLGVVDFVAANREELLSRIDGIQVTLPSGEVTLRTAGSREVHDPLSPFEALLLVLSNPNIALILLSLGTIGIYFELSNPGAFFPGIFGTIALILALFSLGTLPINYAGLALVLFGLALLGAEIWVSSGGALGVGGGAAFLLGALILIDDRQAPFLEISRPLIFGITLALVGFVLVALRAVMRTRRRPAYIGGGAMAGREGIARGASSVFVEGELWRARTVSPETVLRTGDPVRITGREGLDLIVEPLADHARQKES